MASQKVLMVTGASKGFGLEIIKAALAAGDQVVATVRSGADNLFTALGKPAALTVVTMDVTNEVQVKEGVTTALEKVGKIDVLVNNAGYGMLSGIEEAADAEVRKQYDTNVFGLLNVLRAVLPSMRQKRSGHVINISSLFGYDSVIGWGIYGSTKFAVEGISKALAKEVAPLGIKVTSLAPGLFSTDFLGKGSYQESVNKIDDYADTVGQVRQVPEQLHGQQPGDPLKLAQVVIQIAHTDHPPLHLPVGTDAVEMLRNNAAATLEEAARWITVSVSTDHVVKK